MSFMYMEMLHLDRKPSDIMTREAFENAIVTNSAIGQSSLNCRVTFSGAPSPAEVPSRPRGVATGMT
jgi:dehydratase family protein